MKRLIVNADDFGLSPEVNAGVIRAHRDGILGSASLMVAEPAARAGAELAGHNPALDVGLHAVVCQGRSVLENGRLRGAVDASGRFIERLLQVDGGRKAQGPRVAGLVEKTVQ